MKKISYSKEEEAFIAKWGIPSDKDFDSKRTAFTGSGDTKITALFLAQQRKRFLDKQKK